MTITIPQQRPVWPVYAARSNGNGTIGAIQRTVGSVSFTSFDLARRYDLQMAALRNASGVFVTPSASSLVAAVIGVLHDGLPTDFRRSMATASDPRAFGPTYFAFLMTHRDLRDLSPTFATGELVAPDTGKTIKDFLTWAVADSGGQVLVASFAGYHPISCVTHGGSRAASTSTLPCVVTDGVRALTASIKVSVGSPTPQAIGRSSATARRASGL